MAQDSFIVADAQELSDGSVVTPPAVQECTRLLRAWAVWHKISHNLAATSCQDAARKRNRLGHRGIPLWDELKSFLGEYQINGRVVPFMAHCRGDRELSFEKIQQTLGVPGEIRRLSREAAERLGSAYGTVNPFLLASEQFTQIFDLELRRPIGAPGTVMTNAGDFQWAVEFEPTELVLKLPGAKWADIINVELEDKEEVFWGTREPSPIGILTGNPMDSGLDFCHALNGHIRQLLGDNSLGDVSMPEVVMASSPYIGISMEMDEREEPLCEALMLGVDALCAAGARLIAHPAHTTHYFASQLTRRAASRGAQFVSMVDSTAARLTRSGITEIALLGTRYVTDLTQRFSPYRSAFHNITVHVPSVEGWQKIHDLGYEVQQKGPTSTCFNWIRDLLRDEVPPDCQHVVLAMTEFTPVVRQLKSRGRQGKILLDPIDYYAEAVARLYLGLPETEGDSKALGEADIVQTGVAEE